MLDAGEPTPAGAGSGGRDISEFDGVSMVARQRERVRPVQMILMNTVATAGLTLVGNVAAILYRIYGSS